MANSSLQLLLGSEYIRHCRCHYQPSPFRKRVASADKETANMLDGIQLVPVTLPIKASGRCVEDIAPSSTDENVKQGDFSNSITYDLYLMIADLKISHGGQ
jgi:hypothetical protein